MPSRRRYPGHTCVDAKSGKRFRQRVPEPYPDFPQRPQHFKPNGASTGGGARNGACRVTVMRIGADTINDDALKTSCLSDAAR